MKWQLKAHAPLDLIAVWCQRNHCELLPVQMGGVTRVTVEITDARLVTVFLIQFTDHVIPFSSDFSY